MKPVKFLILLFCVTWMPVVFASGYGQLNQAAPRETRQFEFLLGRWHCRTRFLGPDREYHAGQATWTGYYILDGWAIKDDWVSEQPDGTEFHGFNIRSFNPETKKWDNRWLSQGNLQWKYYEAEKRGDRMVMIGGEGVDPNGSFVDRNTFYDISENGWKWRKDRSYDGGETWVEGIGHIEASRMKD